MINKTKPTGVRLNLDQLNFIKTREKLASPQQVVNFLLKAYWDVWHVPKNPFNVPTTEANKKEELPQRTFKKGYEYYSAQIKNLEYQEECNDFVTEVELSDLEDFEKKKLKDTLKARWL